MYILNKLYSIFCGFSLIAYLRTIIICLFPKEIVAQIFSNMYRSVEI